MTIAQDGELGRRCCAAAEAVGAVGQAVLVKRAGGGDEHRQGSDGGEGRRQSQRHGEAVDQARPQTQAGADQGKGAHRLGQGPGGPVVGRRQETGQKPGGEP